MKLVTEPIIKFDAEEERVINNLFSFLNNDFCCFYECTKCPFYGSDGCAVTNFKDVLKEISDL